MLLDGNKEQTEFRSLGKLEGAFGSVLCERHHDPDPSAGTAGAPAREPPLAGIRGFWLMPASAFCISMCVRERAHHSLLYYVSVALFSPFPSQKLVYCVFMEKSLMWQNCRGDESIWMYIFFWGNILKCSQSRTADGILSFKGEKKENKLFLWSLRRTGETEEFIWWYYGFINWRSFWIRKVGSKRAVISEPSFFLLLLWQEWR